MNRFPDFLGLRPFLADKFLLFFVVQTLGLLLVVAQRWGSSEAGGLLPVRGRWRGYLGRLLVGSALLLLGYYWLTEPVDPEIGSEDDLPLWGELLICLLGQAFWLLCSAVVIAVGSGVHAAARCGLSALWRWHAGRLRIQRESGPPGDASSDWGSSEDWGSRERRGGK